MLHPSRALALGAACLIFLASMMLPAAGPAAQISGRVTDPQGAAVSGVRVRVRDQANRIVCSTTTDAQGYFACSLVAGGEFTATATAPGFAPASRAMRLAAGARVQADLQFRGLAPQKQAITVIAASPPVLAPDSTERVVARDEVPDPNPGRPGVPVAIPGIPAETASGGIKAPQYFAPGVAGDHGEPIGQYVQVGDFLYPNNLPANAHGNGYADPNILIPSVLSAVEADAGAFNVREGDHSVDLAATYQLKPRLNSFAQITGDYRDVDGVAGWSPANPAIDEWVAVEASLGNGYLQRLEHRHQYKLNAGRTFHRARHDISLFGIGYYGYSRLPGLIPIGVAVPGDTIDDRQLDRTHTALAAASDTWRVNTSSRLLLSGFFRDYDLTLQSNFGDGLIQQRENRTVAGGEAAYVVKLGHGLNLLLGTDLRRDAPRHLDLKHADRQGLFEPVTSNNFTFGFVEPFASLAGSLGRHIRFDLGARQEEISIYNQDLLVPGNSFARLVSASMPKVSVTLLPPGGTPLPSLSLSGGEAFHTDDPRISTDSGLPGPPNLITTSRAYAATLKKQVRNTTLRLVLARVANSEETANIDADTGLQQYVGPSLNHVLTASAQHFFPGGSVEVSFSRADARDRLTGEPVPEAPRLIWDAVGHYERLPFGLRARGELMYVGRKPLGDGFTGVPLREGRGALLRPFGGGRTTLQVNFLLPSGYTGQTVEMLALPGDAEPLERVVGFPTRPVVALTITYRFGPAAEHFGAP